MSDNKRVLIVDQLNLFFRNYIVNPSLSTDGAPIGGLRGCIQSLQKVVRESKPDMIESSLRRTTRPAESQSA